MTKHQLLHRIKEKVVFFLGDIRRLRTFPWVTWANEDKRISFEEAMEGVRIAQPGDIGIHLDEGFLSNFAIPGFFKHAWIHVAPETVVEAVSEGVIRRHALYPIHSDFTIILRPPAGTVTPKDVELAVKYAERIVGCEYDADFSFDIEEEYANLEHLDGPKFGVRCKVVTLGNTTTATASFNVDEGRRMAIRAAMMDNLRISREEITNLQDSAENLKQSFGAFSCTETVSFAWWHRRKELKIGRKKYAGKEIIAADDFLNGFDIAWKSKSVTTDAVRKKLPEIIVQKIADFK